LLVNPCSFFDVSQLLIIAHVFGNAVKCGQVLGMSRESDAWVVPLRRRRDVPFGHFEELGLLLDENGAPSRCEGGDAAGPCAGKRVEHAAVWWRIHPKQLREEVGGLAGGVAVRITKLRYLKYVGEVPG
jgi:hypothetical protein